MKNALYRLTQFREVMILAIILVAGAAMSFASPYFLTPQNLLAVLLGLSIESIIAIGMTILLVSGGFDMSVGSNLALSSAVTALCMVKGVPIPLAVLAGLGLGAFIGFLNGVIIARVGINPFVTTLAMLSIARGALQVLTRGYNITGLPSAFKALGQSKLVLLPGRLEIQYPILIALVLVFLGDFLLRRSRFFRQNYYIGGNERAAVLSGIAVRRMTIFNYALTGFLAALAGVIMTSRLGAATTTAGVGLELKVISAVIIGGASLQGGEGTVLGAVLGSLLMGIIMNAITLLGIDIYWNELVIGATLLVAVMIDTLGKRRKGLA
jgi:ribose transport system permease protein